MANRKVIIQENTKSTSSRCLALSHHITAPFDLLVQSVSDFIHFLGIWGTKIVGFSSECHRILCS